MKMRFSTDNLERVFNKAENDYEGFQKMLFDYTHGKDIYDEDGNKVSKSEINDRINSVCFDILEIEEGSRPSKREIKRAIRKHGAELYEVLEEVVDFKVSTGFKDNEFFNTFVDMRNLKDGDRNEFYTRKDVLLTVGKTSGSHHDVTMQKLGEGTSYSIKTSNYAVKVGMDIDLYLTGRKDWSEYPEAVAKAFRTQVQNDIYAEVMDAGKKLPVPDQFVKTMELTAANKEHFDELISDVSAANDGADVVIIGLKTDLKKLNALADVDWISLSQKEDVAKTGRLGTYEGTTLMEVPQRFVANDVTKKLITPGKLLIMPNVDNKFVKFIDVGETEIYEDTEKGANNIDFMTHEVQREMGVGTVIDKYHGEWNIA